MILKTLTNPFWVSVKQGILQQAKKDGVQVDIYAVQNESDANGQQQLFSDALNKNYAGIGFAPVTPVNLIPDIVQANQKAIETVNIDEQVDPTQLKNAGGSDYAFVSTDNIKVGQKAANYIVSKLGPAGGQVAIVEGIAGDVSGIDRTTGAEEGFKAGKNVQIVSEQPADWDQNKAMNVATNMIQRFPNLKAIYACNDVMALGVEQAVINANKKIMVVGTDGDPENLQSIKEGKITGTIEQDPVTIGEHALQLLEQAVKDKVKPNPNTPVKIEPVDSKLITQQS